MKRPLLELPTSYQPPSASGVVDGFAVELVSTFLVCFGTVMAWCQPGFVPPNAWSNEFLPAIVTGLTVACIRDRDGVFADASPFVTLMEWVMGAYTSRAEVGARLLGQLMGFLASIGVASLPGQQQFTQKCST